MNFEFINTEYLETVSGGDKEMITELYTIFRDQVTEIVGQMRSSYANEDFYSLNDLAAMLKTFELEGKVGNNKENYIAYIDRFEKEASLAVLELNSYINNL
jgi:hypothetical protein